MNTTSKKLLALILACALLCALPAGGAWGAEAETSSVAQETTDKATEEAKKEKAQKTLEQQQKELQKSIEESEKKLEELGKSSKVTQDYVDTLDRKIGAMNDRLTVLQAQVDESQKAINKLKPQIAANKKQMDALQKEVDAGQKELNKLNHRFEATYQAYCYRLRVMYISGEYSIITALLGCKDISGFLTRYEMIKAVSKSDTELLQEVNSKMEEICSKQNGLNQQKAQFQKVKTDLDTQNKALKEKQSAVERDQERIASSKATLAQDRAESDALLAQLTAQNQMYTEYRNEDEKLQQQVESEISALISGLKNADEVTTLSDKEKEHTTATPGSNAGGKAQGVYSHSDGVLNMTYPVPGHYGVSAGFPNYSSGKYHGGIDFPASTGSRIVAAQSGVVLTVRRLDYSYGYYVMIYHGTDSQGRSVVTLYGHNSSILVSAGETVKKGQQIAKSGSTGNSTGPHCHFEIRLNGARVNPTYYLSK